jgi:hypothetical protein
MLKQHLIERVQEVVRDYYDDKLSLHRRKFAQLTTVLTSFLQPEQTKCYFFNFFAFFSTQNKETLN